MYDPAAQTVQDPPAGPLEPLLHVQSITASLPAGELEYDGQLAHVLEEVAPEADEYLPLGQLAHVLEEVAPEAEEYFPSAQRSQEAEPATAHVHPQASASTNVFRNASAHSRTAQHSTACQDGTETSSLGTRAGLHDLANPLK